MTQWNPEEDKEPKYQTKAHLVLEGSNDPNHTWGVVKDCHGAINYIPEDAEVVGNWARYTTDEYWVSLETPIQALQDKATQLIAEMSERRRREEESRVPVPKRPSTPRAKVESEDKTFDDLRAALRRTTTERE